MTADDFAILAGSSISDTGTSTVIGNVGLDPTGGASITGLTCGEVTGTIFDNNGGYTGGGGGITTCRQTNGGLLTTAKNDLVTAYNDAAGRSPTTQIGTNLGGAVLVDGTYDSATGTFGITGTLTLDGQGNPDSVFIFKTSTTLITDSSSHVVLTNGAQACNVYWQVGSSATLGTSSDFSGTIMALISITDNGSTSVNGRLLARGGDVTLNNTTVTKPSCISPTPTPNPALSPTSTVNSTSNTGSGGSSSPGSTNSGPALNYIPPVIIESNRIDADSIFISWGPYSGISTFIVQYGLENGQWLYSTNISGFSTTLNDLPANQPIWVRIAPRNDNSIGAYGEAEFIGGPRLPNTGSNPTK